MQKLFRKTFKAISRKLFLLKKQCIEKDYELEELNAILYSPTKSDLTRVISTKTSKGYINNSNIKLIEKIDYVTDQKRNKESICEMIQEFICNCTLHIRPWMYEYYIKGKNVRKIAEDAGWETENLRKRLDKEFKEFILDNANFKYLLKACEKDEMLKVEIKEKTDNDLETIIRLYANYVKENKIKNE